MNLLDLASAALAQFEGEVNDPTPAADPGAHRHWSIVYPNIGPLEVIFAPEATRTEVATLYPDARIERMPETDGGTA